MRIDSPFYRPTFAIIDLQALDYNIKLTKSFLAQGTKLLLTVKANGYGHGADQVAKTAIQAGADMLSVATLEEGIALRQAGVEAPILVFGVLSRRGLMTAALQRLTVSFTGDEDWLHHLDDLNVFEEFKHSLDVHIKVDTGMNRLGVKSLAAFVEVVQQLQASSRVRIAGLYTHFATSDEANPQQTKAQIHAFQPYVDFVRTNLPPSTLVHASNSGGTMRHPKAHYNMVRLGIGAYGYGVTPRSWTPAQKLKPVMHLFSAIVRIAEVQAGETIGYGATFTAVRRMRVATLPIGYADGYFRIVSNRGYVLLHKQRAPIVGRVCMDQIMVDITDINYAKVGDIVTLFGYGAPECWSWQEMESRFEETLESHLSAGNAMNWLSTSFCTEKDEGIILLLDELAEWAHTIPYEWTCAVGQRIPRIYT